MTPVCRRCGFSLIELMVTMTVATAVLASVGTAMHLMFQMDHRLRTDVASSMHLPRLAIQLRRDAHLARSAQLAPAGNEAVLSLQLLDDRRVEYEIGQRQVERRVFESERFIEQGHFPLGDTVEARWERRDAEPFIRLLIERRSGRIPAAADATRTTAVEAAVGLITFQRARS